MTDATLQTVLLRDERSSLQATFVPGAGMLCASLRHGGEELLAQNAGIDAYATRGKTMGIPLLYPWANRLAGMSYSVAGRTVTLPHDPTRIALDGNGLPIHGVIGGRLRWQVTTPTSGTTSDSIFARLTWSESTSDSTSDSVSGLAPELFELFPFRHDLEYRAQLDDGRMQIEVTVHASGEDPVPVAFGFHPYLSLTGASRERWSIELPAMRRLQLDAHQIPTGSARALSAQRFELGEREFDDGFDSLAEPAHFSATACAAAAGAATAAEARRIELESLNGYPCAQVYAPRGTDFICFEPMTAPANALRSGIGLRVLDPGERYTAAFAVQVTNAAS